MADPPFPEAPSGSPPKVWNIQKFSGINTQAKRPAIDNNEFSWLQNFFPIGDGNMRTMWDAAAPVYTAPSGKTIIYYYFFNLGAVEQCAVFLSDGTAVQVNPGTGSTTTISAIANDFYDGGSLPNAAQWNSAGIIFVTEASDPNGYFAWDGTTLYRPGANAPNWLTDNTPTVMPSGVHGNAVETYNNRAWVTTPTPAVILNTGASNGADFNTDDGGGAVPQQDSSLKYTFTALQQTNGFLYFFGDSSTGAISNVQTSGGVTSYSNQNVDPQKGTLWNATVQPFTSQFGPGIMFANPQGVYLLVGGSVQKVSYDLDGIFANADFQTVVPSAALAIIFGVTVYSLLIKTQDQNGNPITVMCQTDGKPKGAGFRWWLASQSKSLTYIATNEVASSISTWGTDGTSLFQCFAAPSASLAKSMQTKFFAGDSSAEYIIFKKLYRFYFQAIDNAGSGITFSGTFDSDFANTSMLVNSLVATNQQGNALQAQNIANQNLYPVTFGLISAGSGVIIFVNNAGGVIQFVNNSGGAINFTVSTLLVPMTDASCYGRLMGATLGSISTDFTLVALTMLYTYDAPYGG